MLRMGEWRGEVFQSTRPMRGATDQICYDLNINKFQSTRPMRGATDRIVVGEVRSGVSIHAPHAGRDS